MSRYHAWINTARNLLAGYRGEEPFPAALKKYFAAHKNAGSRDRKAIAHLCYCFFRTGNLTEALPPEERLVAGVFLCAAGPDPILEAMQPDWNAAAAAAFEQKCALLNIEARPELIFPWSAALSTVIAYKDYCLSFLQQPDLFIRIRPGYRTSVLQRLEKAGVIFKQVADDCLALPNATRVETLLQTDREVVVQDRSSQQVLQLAADVLPSAGDSAEKSIKVWDCCAGSGGKSIMACDLFGRIELTVSDIRESILLNLRKRFESAGIKNYRAFTADLAAGKAVPADSSFNLIIADVPCTGSGTWGRSPEQLYYFKEEKITQYAALQQKIVSSVWPALKPGGFLLYSTCSVFETENEGVVEYMKTKFHPVSVRMEWLKGYTQKADSMFAAILRKPL